MKIDRRNGISLIILVVTIIVILLLASIIIFSITQSGTLDKSKKAKFMNDFTAIQEGVNIYSFGKYNASTGEFELPLKGYLTEEDKIYIKDNIPTLNTKIVELSGSLDTANLAWIDTQEINAKLSSAKQQKGYIVDVKTGQIYDYNGDLFEGKRWHTLDNGVAENETPKTEIAEELWNGWIKLTLYYPIDSIERKWRLGAEGELRSDPMLMWQNYVEAIKIPLDRVKDVWIKYKINNKEVIIPPAGTLLVDIVPDKTSITSAALPNENTNAYAENITEVKVNINYDEGATTKEYRIGSSGWITYNGEFSVTENCIIEARAKKIETIYNTDGTVLATRDVAGKDLVYVGNIGIGDEDINLTAPTIIRLPAVGTEKARVQITYPVNADKKIYKLNSGVEVDYTDIINVNNYGTYIIAYYYDSTGKRSSSTSMYINDTSTGLPEDPPAPYDPEPPVPILPNDVPPPTVNVSPTTFVEEVQLSIAAPENADKIYIKLGKYGSYEEYTSAITIKENTQVYAYYRTYTGEISNIGYGVVSNIKKNNKPYVYINANPYPWSGSYGVNEVTVTINYSDADTIEYSEDGIVYKPYVDQFTVKENKRIYARAVNTYGVTETSLNITNIGKLDPPTSIEKLLVNINVNPEPVLSVSRVEKVTVTIDYASNVTEKYYTIGKYGTLQTYTGPFDVTSNCTIYAYAKGLNAKGETSKTIDNLLNGISQPIITSTPSSVTQASKVDIGIEYDKYATVKKYSIDGGTLIDYIGQFEIAKNSTKIYAYSENDLGQKSESSYLVENIVPDSPTLLLDKGSYYLLKLNYPVGSQKREYKWKAAGEWKDYNNAGIILIKPEFKDQLLQGGTLVKIEDENGNMVSFTGDYYLIDVPISELFENLFMRWDRQPANAPQIVITPTGAAKQVAATITYNNFLVKKQYRVVKPGELAGEWLDYTGSIIIDKNNTVIYAKGMDDVEIWSLEGMLKVTNIDENPPVINLIADLTTGKKKVGVKVTVTDDIMVGKIKWKDGIQDESYFETNGVDILNNATVDILENGYYTFYAEDTVGNKQIYTLNVTNIYIIAPENPILSATPNTWTNGDVTVTITYPMDATIKEYSTNGITWKTYSSPIAISTNNTTVYARCKDAAGNQSGQSTLTVTNIDKSAPTISYGTNGGNVVTNISTTVTVTDVDLSGINPTSLQYVWDTQNTVTPTSGWTLFTNAQNITKSGVEGLYYLWIKASDNAGNNVITKSKAFAVGEAVIPVTSVKTENSTINDGTASYNNPIIPAGFMAVNTPSASWDNVSTDWDKGLVIQDLYDNQFVWVPVDGTNVPYAKWCTTNISYNNANISDDTLPSGFSVSNITTMYKGFYIARYETMFDYNGGNIRAASKKSSNKTTSAWQTYRDSAHSGYLWNSINYADAKYYSENMATSYGYNSTKVGTNLITGAQWDTVLKWMQNSGVNVVDSRTWANYSNAMSPANVSGMGALQISGYSIYWRAKNVYDIAGNTFEWTSERYSTTYPVYRSGYYSESGTTYGASYRRYYNPVNVNYSLSFRMALYIK